MNTTGRTPIVPMSSSFHVQKEDSLAAANHQSSPVFTFAAVGARVYFTRRYRPECSAPLTEICEGISLFPSASVRSKYTPEVSRPEHDHAGAVTMSLTPDADVSFEGTFESK